MTRLPAEALAAAEPRAREWQEACGADDAAFRRRLSSASLDWEGFVRLLAAREAAQSPAAKDEGVGEWVQVLEEIRLGSHREVALHPVQWTNPDGTRGTEPPFGSFLRPFLQCGVGRLRAGLEQIEERAGTSVPLIETSVEIQLALDLTERLTKQCSSTLILELHAARLRGLLPGATSYERFRFFSERFFTPAKVLKMLREYPALARLLSLTVCRWAEATLEFLARLAADRVDLGAIASPQEASGESGSLATLRSVRVGISDLHRGGRSVVIAEDVDGRKVVYKPNPLAIDAQMQRLVVAVNGFGLRHPLAPIRLLDRGEYGWQEHVEAEGCESVDALHRFYWRQGCWIAVLHLVRGADIHHENLIARGEYPVLVDNEALFHHSAPSEAAPETAREDADVELARSVIRQGLLPFVFRLTMAGEGVDSSGLGGARGQVARGSVRRWSEPGTDRMRVVLADLVTQESQNRPSLDGERVDASSFLPDIVQGFRETYDILAARREELHRLLDGFAGLKVRHLVRPTRVYTVFLREGYHPNDLRDGLDREELLDRLWAAVPPSPELQRVVPYEHEDLYGGDIPVFFTQPGSTHLWSSGGQRMENFFPRSSLLEARRLLDEMSEDDRERQVLLIRLTLSEARSRARDPEPKDAPPRDLEIDRRPLPPADLHAAATDVGEALKRRALAGERGGCWISLDPFVNDRPGDDKLRNIALAQDDLYHGSAGIAMFLAYLGQVTAEGDYTDLARATLRSMREGMAATRADANQVLGAFLGRASYSYVLLHLAALWSEPTLLDEALADLPAIEHLIPADEEFDILAGTAGCAIVMLRLYASTHDPAALRLARACGDHLLRTARPAHGGVGWTGHSFAGPVVGLAHGAAGIAWALLELAAATGDERYRKTALEAVVFERNLIASPEGEPFHTRVSWCHGLPSIALARVLSSAAIDEPLFRGEIEAGAERVLAAGRPADSGLCHGVLGNAEILATCGRHCDVEAWRHTADAWAEAAARGVEALERELLLPLHGRFAGLLCGLAGIGWGLLRFAHRDKIPSVLMLEPPPSPNSARQPRPHGPTP